jgi:hypothetical protein
MNTRNHLPNPARAVVLAAFVLILVVLAWGQAGGPASSCADCPVWNKPQQPFRVCKELGERASEQLGRRLASEKGRR